jgi:hypothetical protein
VNSIVKITIEAYGQTQVLEMPEELAGLKAHRPLTDPERIEQEAILGQDIYETLDRMLEGAHQVVEEE